MSDTRAFEMTIEIAVSPDAVWQAITNPGEVTRWFAPRADVQPGPGGKWLVSWDGNWPWNMEIEIWEPNRRLRLVDREGRPYDASGKAVNASVTPLPIAIDWHLQGTQGSTTLRLVHSGFGRGGAWDDEFDGVSLGWLLELNGLKHYLEHHLGQQRQVAWSRVVVAAPPDVLWERLIDREGIILDPSVISLSPGERYATTLGTGDRIEGRVAAVAQRGLQVTVDGWNHALYRLWIDRVGNESAVNSWLSVYGMPAAFTAQFDRRMREVLSRVAEAATVA